MGLSGLGQKVGTRQSPVQVSGNPMPMKSLLCWPLSSLVSESGVCLSEAGVCGGVCVRKTYILTHPIVSSCMVGSKFYDWKNISVVFSTRKSSTCPEGQHAPRKAKLSPYPEGTSPFPAPAFCL